MAETLFLPGREAIDLATAPDYVAAVRRAFEQRGEGAPATSRTELIGDEMDGRLYVTMASLPAENVMGPGYVLSGGSEESSYWMLTPLFARDTGAPLALIDAASTNPYKTAATNAVATDELARDDAETLGIFGCGIQAQSQLLCLDVVRDLRRVKVYSRTESTRERFAAAMDERIDPTVTAVDTSAAVLENADIVVTATTSGAPVFDGERLEAGTHVTAMGQYGSDVHEVDATTVRRSKYVLDLTDRVSTNAGAFISAASRGELTEDHIYAELGDVVAGTVAGRESPDEITLFDHAGTAIETVAAANLLYEAATTAGCGTPLEFETMEDGLERWTL
jgi:alanine dehydrogenase